MQDNDAYAMYDVVQGKYLFMKGFGAPATKLDPSDKDDRINIRSSFAGKPAYKIRMPDQVTSFTKDGIFPPEEHFRYNYRPATVAGGAYGARAGGAFGGTGPAGAFADAAARDAAAGGGRPGTSTLRMQTLIGTPKATSGRGASRLGVRSGGFQLFELERVLAD